MNKDINNKIEEVAHKYGLEFVLLFGSEVSGSKHKESDLDVAFFADKKITLREQAEIATDLMRVFKREDVDIVDLRTASPLLMKRIAKNSTVLYEKTQSSFNEFYLYALRAQEDARVLSDLRRNFLDYKVKEYSHV